MLGKLLIFALILLILWVAIKFVLLPIIKFLFHFIKRLLLSLPFLIISLFIPTFYDESVLLLIVAFIAFIDCLNSTKQKEECTHEYITNSFYSPHHFTLNKKSKVAHKSDDHSASTIAPNHAEEVFMSPSEITAKGYRIKH